MPGREEGRCLSGAQVNAIRAVMQGPRTSSGRQVYPGYFYDTGIATTQGLPGVLAGPVIPEGRPVGTTFDVDAAAAEPWTHAPWLVTAAPGQISAPSAATAAS